jgi:hypothetical protein
MLPSFLVVVLAVIAVASLWHGVTEHYWHRQAWRVLNSGAYVPPPRQDTRWHGMSHPRRMAVMLALAAAAALLAAAWHWQPQAAVITACTAAVIAVIVPGARAAARALGERHRPVPPRRNHRRKES